jgi:peptide/nickel transport system permease protein
VPERTDRQLLGGALMVLVLVAMAAGAPWLTSYDPSAIVVTDYRGPLPPGGAHPLGTDTLGRDVWTRLVFAARTSLLAALLGTGIAVTVGTAIGLVSGWAGGWIDAVCMWCVDLVLTVPTLLLLIVLAALLPPSLLTVPIVIGSVGWTAFARTVRGEVLSLRGRDSVVAAVALGARPGRILVHHLLPGVRSTVVALAALGVAGAIAIESGLGYLGLGAPLPTPSWGRMVSEAQTYFVVAPWLVVLPGVAIVLAVIAFTLLGQGLVARATHGR